MVVFRSIVIPIKAILMNLLSVGTAYGLLVLVFQKGIGADLLGFQQTPIIDAWIPLFLFSILFGLSMDYHVFLLSRIRERYDQTHDNAEAVAHGLRSTAGNGHFPRRHPGPVNPGPRKHAASGVMELVPAVMAALAPGLAR